MKGIDVIGADIAAVGAWFPVVRPLLLEFLVLRPADGNAP